jgi:N-methylhydantoinase A
MTTLIGIDTGGTFTDLVLCRDGRLLIHKVPSTPRAPEQAILRGIIELGLDLDIAAPSPTGTRVIHGSTVATNAVLEGKGVRTVYIGNRGLKDLLTIGRQARAALYDLQPPRPRPPVPEELCLETGGRIGADGREIEPLTDADLGALVAALERLRPEAVAVNLLFSYLDDRAERAIAARIPDGIFVARSSRVLPMIGEYERGIATWINAWIGPIVARYLRRLEASLPGMSLAVMQSSGEAVAAEQTADMAVRLLLSGPAGGLVGAGFVARMAGIDRVLTFDMGGTSTDVALVDGAPILTTAGRIGGWPIAVPMVDMHTIGAGGGSIARLDIGGALQVGPESAGADPGPVCYGLGGIEPTVTDANLVLGRLRPDAFLGGRMRLDDSAAAVALLRLGKALGLDGSADETGLGIAEQAALGVIAIANEHMAQALRVISVQRGIDPRDLTLCSFGGAGGLHVCALAEALGIGNAIVPIHAGVLSALGMLATPPGRVLTRTWPGLLGDLTDSAISTELDLLAAEAAAALEAEGQCADALTRADSLDLRYQGQSYTLNLVWNGIAPTTGAFHARHRERYGHSLDLPVELVNLRVRVTAPPYPVKLVEPATHPDPPTKVRVADCATPATLIQRDAIAPETVLHGPAVILDEVATTWLAPGWQARRDRYGNLLLRRE